MKLPSVNRFLLLFVLLLCQQNSFAAVYKCEREGGKIEYQSSPCEKGREITVTTAQGTAPGKTASLTTSNEKRKCVGKELRINFTNMPVKATLQVLADFSGNKLMADSSVNGSGAFSYECTSWEIVLQDIASRHNLAVRIENGTIFATKR